MLLFFKWKKIKAFLMGVFVQREIISKPFIELFGISISMNLLSKSPGFVTCEGSNILAMVQTIMGVALSMLKIMDHRGMFGLWI